MELNNAVEQILNETLYWIEMNKGRGTWVAINFPSKFLHTCKILANVKEFGSWSTIRFLKARNLDFDFNDDGELTKVRFNVSPGEYMSASIGTLNVHLGQILQRLMVTGLSTKYRERRGVSFINEIKYEGTTYKVTGITHPTKDEPLINLTRINNFKFATT